MTDELNSTLHEITTRLETLNIAYMLVGSVAALVHGRSRSTQDFDIVIEVNASALRTLVRTLPQDRFYVSEAAALEALKFATQFNVIDMDTGWKVDLIPKKDRAFSETEFDRRKRFKVLGSAIFVASLEDTIVSKLEWAAAGGGSRRQLEDVRELVRLAGERLDKTYVRRWINALGLEEMWSAAVDDNL